MVDAAGLEDGQPVLEIGPGLGILTRALLNRGANVIAVELDRRLYAYMKKSFKGQARLRLINNDIFKVNLNELFQEGEYAVVANLPYGATSLVFRNFLTLPPRPAALTVMVQREVARRICAAPGEMSMLALTVQYYSRPSLLFDIPPKSFFPIPQVTSSVVYCDGLKKIDQTQDKKLFRLMKAGFSARRKKLANSLSTLLPLSVREIETRMAKVSLSANVRAQELSINQWLDLRKQLS